MPPASLADLPVNRWLGLTLTPDEIATKNGMILTYRSQLARFDMLLRAFSRRNEIYSEVLDVRLMPEDLAVQGVFQEPTADSASVRRRPYADLSEVDLWTDGETLEIRARTVTAQQPDLRMQVLVHVVDPAPGGLRTLDVETRAGVPPQFSGATDSSGPDSLAAKSLTTTTLEGNTRMVGVPCSLLGGHGIVMVDVLTKVNRRTVDHSITRLLYLPAPKP